MVAAASDSIQRDRARDQVDVIEGIVVGVTDGATLKVLSDDRRTYVVRLQGIDAPELKQKYGQALRQALAALAAKQRVTVATEKKDRYGRYVARVYAGDTDLSLEQIRSGNAWWFRKYGHEQNPSERRWDQEAEKEARLKRIGLWRDSVPTPPWEWRAQHSR